jgi:hypothetical protein
MHSTTVAINDAREAVMKNIRYQLLVNFFPVALLLGIMALAMVGLDRLLH